MSKEKSYQEFTDTLEFITRNVALGVSYSKDANYELALDEIKELEGIIRNLRDISQKERLEYKGIVIDNPGITT